MATVTYTWPDSVSTNSALVPANVVVTVSGGALGLPAIPSVTVAANALTADILNVPVEASTDPLYVVSAQMVDASGASIGAPSVSDPFSILTPPAVIMTPGKGAVTVKP